MIHKHKNSEWLQKCISDGLTPPEIAVICNVSEKTILDSMLKNKLLVNTAIQLDDYTKDVDILRLCGERRSRIPLDVMLATTPKDHDTIAIFGGSGFVGTNLVEYLKTNTAHNVIQFDRNSCDVMNRNELQALLNYIRPNVVVNLAAFVGGIGLNKDNPADMIHRNIVMSANIVDACFTAGIRKLVYLGTVCSYPHTPPRIPFVEDDLWFGRPELTNEPYGAAKKLIGLMLDSYKKQFNFSSAYLIPTNMYGPFDDFSLHGSHVIPAMIRKFIDAKRNNTTVVNWGDGTASRDFLYVYDCCEAIHLAIEDVDDPTPINIGSGYECSMAELSQRIASSVGYSGDVVWDTSKPNGQPRRCLDTTRACETIGFSSKTDLQLGIDETVRWYIENAGY